MTWGNGYSEIERRVDGQAENYWPLRPDLTAPVLRGDDLFYEVRPAHGGESTFLPARNVLHIQGLGGNGYQGYSVIQYHREAIGLGKATEQYGSAFFGNNATPSGVLSHPAVLGETARENLRREFEDKHGGLDNVHRIALLEEGLKWTQIGIPAKDAQLLESKTFSVLDVSRMYQIPPHMLGEMSSATFSNIEEQTIAFVQMTMLRWLTKWETEIDFKILPKTHFAKFVIEGLLRGNSEARSRFYREMHNNGFLTLNQVLALENMNGIGPDGDRHLVNAALKPIEDIGKEPPPLALPPPPPAPAPAVPETDSFRPLLFNLCGRIARRETKTPIKSYAGHQAYIWEALSVAMETIYRVLGRPTGDSERATAKIAQEWREASEKDKPTDWKQLRDDRCDMIMGVLQNAFTNTE